MPASAGGWTREARSQVLLRRSASAWFIWVSSGRWAICQPEGSVHTTGLVRLPAEVPRHPALVHGQGWHWRFCHAGGQKGKG